MCCVRLLPRALRPTVCHFHGQILAEFEIKISARKANERTQRLHIAATSLLFGNGPINKQYGYIVINKYIYTYMKYDKFNIIINSKCADVTLNHKNCYNLDYLWREEYSLIQFWQNEREKVAGSEC